jgi:hypothetical protein
MIFVAMYCRLEAGCEGMVKIGLADSTASYGRARFSIPGKKTSHVPIHVSSQLMALVRMDRRVSVIVRAVMGRTTYAREIVVRIL